MALVSAFIAYMVGRTHLANISMVYLIAVLVIAASFGSGPAILASLAAFLAFDFLFTEPYYTLTVADPTEWVALLLFLATAVITGQLAAGQRRRAEEARRREREAVGLYDVARLTAGTDLRSALAAVAERVRAELGVAGVAIEIDDPAIGTVSAGDIHAPSMTSTPAQLLREGTAPTAEQPAGAARWVAVVPPASATVQARVGGDRLFVVPIGSGPRRLGTMSIAGVRGGHRFGASESRMLSALAGQIAQAVERERLRRDAVEAELLRRSDELKTAVLNAVSHDLRTPLASIIASAGSLLQEDVAWTPDDRREFVLTIEHEAARLNAIIANLLDLSRMEAGILRPKKGWYDLGALVDDVLGRLRPVTARHTVAVNIPEDLPPLELDYVEIDEVLTNLVENAVKFAPAGSEIRVAARRGPDTVEVEVADRGPGLTPDALPRVFDAFFRAEDARLRVKGTGLGLAVAKGLVTAHGGRIWAENRSGGGTRFVFALPLGAPVETGA